MQARNLTFFRFPPNLELADLESALSECQLRSVGPLELSTSGFIAPLGQDSEELAHKVGDHTWISVGSETRILPGAVVNAVLAEKLAEIEEKEGTRPGGRARKALKDQVLTELIPKAFVQPGRVDASIDHKRGLIVIDTSSRKKGEAVVSEVRRALGSFPALPLNTEVAPRSVMTGWLAGGELPEGLALGDECELRDPVADGAVWKGSRTDLGGEEIARHLESGKQCTRVALYLEDRLSFVIGEDMIVRKLKLLDAAVDDLQATDADDLKAELDARYALMSGEIARLFDVLEAAFKVSKVESEG